MAINQCLASVFRYSQPQAYRNYPHRLHQSGLTFSGELDQVAGDFTDFSQGDVFALDEIVFTSEGVTDPIVTVLPSTPLPSAEVVFEWLLFEFRPDSPT